MTDSKTYLNVPYAQKDAAKALGARWDPSVKKWYVPAGKDATPFAQWQDNAAQSQESVNKTAINRSATTKANQGAGVFTYPALENFVGYAGELPPWD